MTTPGALPAGTPATMRRGFLALEAVLLLLLVLTLAAWFAARPRGLDAGVPAGALLAAGVAWLLVVRPKIPRPSPETLTCLGLAVVYRLPALLHPWGWVNRDGAYGAFVTLRILQGMRPAPAFTEGANYQGTLKSHVAALLSLLTGAEDLSFLMTAASLVLYLVFVAATMALARRVAGRGAALVSGLYLALSPRFVTVFSLNCVGQYVDVLALGGLALALLARLLAGELSGRGARGHYLGLGVLLGAAFWAQPVAVSYVGVAALVLALRRRTWRDPWALLAPAGLLVGLLPLLLWNIENAWATREIVERDPEELRAQVEALPHLVRRTLMISFPILAGVSPGHPWAELPGVRPAAAAVIPILFASYVLLVRRKALARPGSPSPALLPPLLLAACLASFWAVAAGSVLWRPRYLLPLTAATAVHLGVVAARAWAPARALAVLAVGLLLALNVAGTLPRLRESRPIAEYYRRIVRSLEEKGIRTGYADFSLSAPVTMFTAERIVLSPRLGPTPAYESEVHARRVDEEGPDAFVLRPEEDVERFASLLRGLGVGFRMEREPVPVFYALSRRVRLEEVLGFRGEEGGGPAAPPE